MSRIIWTPPALYVFYELSPHTAMVVDRAVIRFAQTGEGHLSPIAPHHRLRAGVHDAVLDIDVEADTVTVLHLYRMRR